MKNRIVLIAIFALLFYCGQSVTAENNIQCVEHTLTPHSKVDPTCTESGTEAYWSCDICGKMFSDAEASNEIESPTRISTLGHIYGTPTFFWDTNRMYMSDPVNGLGYDLEIVRQVQATFTCTRCGGTQVVNAFSVETGEVIDHGCFSVGESIWIATASFLGEEYTSEPQSIMDGAPRNSHWYGDLEYIWNEEHTACVARRKCQYCDDIGEEYNSARVTESFIEPTCTNIGGVQFIATFYIDGIESFEYIIPEQIPALGHDLVQHKAKAATCAEIGWDAYDTCSRCDYTTYTEIPALGHDLVHHEAKAATCTEIGWEAYDTCSRCDYTTYVEIPALGHDLVHHEAKAATCTEIGWNAYETCSRCDYTTYVEIEALGHDLVQHEAKAATCTAIGWDAYETCKSCDYTTYSEIEALGHDWDAAEYEWSADHTSVTAKRVCKRDASHIETENVDVSLIIISPTEKNEGSANYTSSEFSNEAFTIQTKSLVIPALKDMSVIRLPNMLTTIELEAFMNLACQAIIIPEGCTTIGEYAFAGCTNLVYVRIPASVKNYPANAFEGCNEKLVIDWIKE